MYRARLGSRGIAARTGLGSIRVKEIAHARKTVAGCRPRSGGRYPRPGRRFRRRAAIAAPRRDCRRRRAGAEGPVGLLPRLGPRVRGALGLAYAWLLPLHGPARLLR